MKKRWLVLAGPGILLIIAAAFVIMLLLVKLLWAWTVPDLFPGARAVLIERRPVITHKVRSAEVVAARGPRAKLLAFESSRKREETPAMLREHARRAASEDAPRGRNWSVLRPQRGSNGAAAPQGRESGVPRARRYVPVFLILPRFAALAGEAKPINPSHLRV